jgi:DNA-binding NarL/FixJ family response regulator
MKGLTPREHEVLTMLADGETNARIAQRLVVTEDTVKSHVKHILRKLGAQNRSQAVSRYFRLHATADGRHLAASAGGSN